MHLTRGTQYAILGLLHLGSQNGRRRILVSEIAKAEDLSPSYLAKIFQQLRKAGLVTSHRGTRGGFRLRVQPRYIQLRQIVEATQGMKDAQPCCSSAPHCSREPASCPLSVVWAKINNYTRQTLEITTLSDLLPPKPKKA
ncbi:MAG: Rrf2 family transcriptional regulator [Planctomycetota bacterium]